VGSRQRGLVKAEGKEAAPYDIKRDLFRADNARDQQIRERGDGEQR